MFWRKLKFPLIIGCLLIMIALLVNGCRNSNSSTGDGVAAVQDQGIEENLNRGKELSDAEGVETSSKVEKEIAEAAINYAQDSNAGSSFEVTAIIVAGKWARADIQEIDVPVEEAVAFVVFMRKDSKGDWKVEKTGTNVVPQDLPDAPSVLFK